MAVKIRGLDKAIRNIKKTLSKDLRDKTLLNAIGEEIVLDIQNNTFKGKSSITGKRFKRYSNSYKDTIKGKTSFRTINGKVVPLKPGLAEDGATFGGKNASRPNLFVSGQLLKALTHKVDKNNVLIFTKPDERTKYPNQKKKPSINNAKLSEIVSKDRPYIGLTQKALKKITNRIKRFFK